MTWKAKFKTIWNEAEIKELLQQLDSQQGAIDVLISLLQMDSLSDIRRTQRRHEALLKQIAANAQSVRKAHTIEAPGSIFDAESMNGSIFDQLAEKEKPDRSLESSFEDIILDSHVYKKTFVGVLGPRSEDDFDDTHTITDTNPPDKIYEQKHFENFAQPLPVAIGNRVTRTHDLNQTAPHRSAVGLSGQTPLYGSLTSLIPKTYGDIQSVTTKQRTLKSLASSAVISL
ncbi:hypothetical protein BDV95DRAFT_7215 [Massariosphaeria phaeospora]|uniref:Uncharacterized protein n=1 Tax=Massariosphaeria phaeospora TaxID=100035 RepID=A0A7C8MVD9_9PLEO|nr:hypothetical protein BDV95DRAFT_7215 [Massariosphaeria phaeospora]